MIVKPRGCASEEQQGGAAEIPSQVGVEHGTRLDLHILGRDRPLPIRSVGEPLHAVKDKIWP